MLRGQACKSMISGLESTWQGESRSRSHSHFTKAIESCTRSRHGSLWQGG